MAGRNLYLLHPAATHKRGGAAPQSTCVFISHKREDKELASQVAALFTNMDVDFWLDLVELRTSAPSSADEHRKLTEAIETGLANSTHLLALITPQTKGSWWVPYEIGSARSQQKPLAFLLHRDVPDMPSYFIYGDWLVDQQSLVEWAQKLSAEPVAASFEALSRLLDPSALEPFLQQKRRFA